jgi:transposase-like protein
MDLNDLIKNPDQIKNLIEVLQALLPKAPENIEDTEESVSISKAKSKNPTKSASTLKTRGGQRRRKSNDNDGLNKFESMSEFGMHKEDSAIDKVLSKIPPVARTRDEAEPIDVVCRICGKKESVSPSLIFDSISRYKCNTCATQSG